jgi:hypothetical protein
VTVSKDPVKGCRCELACRKQTTACEHVEMTIRPPTQPAQAVSRCRQVNVATTLLDVTGRHDTGAAVV